MKKLLIVGLVAFVLFVGSAPAASHRPARWQRISACFMRHGWILEVNTPRGGLAYPRGGGEDPTKFQQWVAWWIFHGRPHITATSSGLLTNAQEAVGRSCVGPALNG